ncbi:hypothetical protein BH23PLA1_BH23PLA1_40960 [soil metagenome]
MTNPTSVKTPIRFYSLAFVVLLSLSGGAYVFSDPGTIDRFLGNESATVDDCGPGEIKSCCVGIPSRSELLRVALAAQAAVAEKAEAEASESPTYSKDVALILQKHCQECHRGDQIGPFPMMTYEQARKRAADIALVTDLRRMPPWPASPDYGPGFAHDRSLSGEEIEILNAWAEAGALEGTPDDLPPPREFTSGWTIGEPDLIIEMPEDFEVPADGPDIYRCFVIPLDLPEDVQVVGLEYRPGNPSVVHHILGYVDVHGKARKLDEADPDRPGYDCFGGPMIDIHGDLGGWAPGSNAEVLPEGVGRILPAKADIVLQVHYHPSGKAETDRSRIGLKLAPRDQSIRQAFHWWAVGDMDFTIPADVSSYELVTQTLPLPVDVQLLKVSPHMHLLGKMMEMWAEPPEGKTFADGTNRMDLIRIDHWDFNWQLQYQLIEPIDLPAGSVVKARARYDNSENNPHRPLDAEGQPMDVRFGEATTDEMCFGFFGMVKTGQDLTRADEEDDLLKILYRQLKEFEEHQKAKSAEADD